MRAQPSQSKVLELQWQWILLQLWQKLFSLNDKRASHWIFLCISASFCTLLLIFIPFDQHLDALPRSLKVFFSFKATMKKKSLVMNKQARTKLTSLITPTKFQRCKLQWQYCHNSQRLVNTSVHSIPSSTTHYNCMTAKMLLLLPFRKQTNRACYQLETCVVGIRKVCYIRGATTLYTLLPCADCGCNWMERGSSASHKSSCGISNS